MEAIQHLAADVFFLGVTGVDPVHGLTTGELDDAVTKRALASRCTETVVLASVEKVGAAARFPVLPFEAITAIITDPLDANPIVERLAALISARE